MKMKTWEKLSALVLGMLLPCAAIAQSLSGDALNEANTLSALRKTYSSLLVEETIQMDDTMEQRWFWDGLTADGRSLQVEMQEERQREIIVLDGVFYELDMERGTLSCCAWLPETQKAFAENWDEQLQIFSEDLDFTAEGNTAAASLFTMSEDGTIREEWKVDAATHALKTYTCEAAEMSGKTTEMYLLSVTYDAVCLLDDDMLERLSGPTFTLTLVDEKGNEVQQQLSADLPIHFTDGMDHLLFFRDKDLSIPADTLDPATEDVTNGVTLYYVNE